MDSLELVPGDARREVSSALLEMGVTASNICTRLWATPPAAESRAAELMGHRAIGDTGFTNISGLLAAGIEHFNSFARLMRLPVEAGPSLATLVRGGIESLGRGWWLLDSATAAQLGHRAASMDLADVQEMVAKGEPVERVYPDGHREPDPTALLTAQRQLDDFAVPGRRERVPGFTDLAVRLMSAADVERPATVYSHLAGAAHGMASVLGTFGVPNRDKAGSVSSFRLGLPIRNARMYVWAFGHSLDTVLTRLTEFWGVPAESERWTASVTRVGNTIDRLFEVLES